MLHQVTIVDCESASDPVVEDAATISQEAGFNVSDANAWEWLAMSWDIFYQHKEIIETVCREECLHNSEDDDVDVEANDGSAITEASILFLQVHNVVRSTENIQV